jgi:topoisomerase-4 subunit A
MSEEKDLTAENKDKESGGLQSSKSLKGLYQDWFLDYASYVILERAVPSVVDGLKPVHRRIMHSMKELDDGRFHKVANIIGNTMKYHPHGDTSIGNALVQLGQKDLLVETQGNWGNTLTGDSAAAPRYIEARLSKFALDVAYSPKITKYQKSYDGRNDEPIDLPVKFPLLLAQGVDGIAVGLASKIMPHNFNELIDASINYLNNKDFTLYPDFQTGGLMEVDKYNDGLRGGRIRVRGKIEKRDKKILAITEIPATTNTNTLIESIVSATDKGKIKVKKIEDNTSDKVEILLYLHNNVSPDQTIDALYAFTNCEISISPNSCVIDDDKPIFIGVKELLKRSTDLTRDFLKQELEIKKGELQELWHYASLEKIFIKERIYRKIEEAESWEQSLEIIDTELKPFKKLFHREIIQDDIIRLTEIKIKRISKYNEFKADEKLKQLEEEIKEVEYHLANLTTFAINYFKEIKKKYGKGRERKTEIRNFENIDRAEVAAANVRLYVNREEGFIGTALRKDEFVTECSDIDDIIVFKEDGKFMVTRADDKIFVGKNIIHVDVWKKGDERTVYNMIYKDGKNGKNYVKRFPVNSITRDKDYDLTQGKEGSKVLYFTANPNGEAEVIKVKLRKTRKLRKTQFEFDFSDLGIKSRNAKGNILTKHIISTISLKEDGISTLGAINIWFDESVRRLNTDERGVFIGSYKSDDMILSIHDDGNFKTIGYDLNTHFDDNMMKLNKFNEETVFTAIYFEGESEYYYVKRFQFEEANNAKSFITEHKNSKLIHITDNQLPKAEIIFSNDNKPRNKDSELIDINEFIDVKSFKAKGKRLTTYGVKKIKLIEPEEGELKIENHENNDNDNNKPKSDSDENQQQENQSDENTLKAENKKETSEEKPKEENLEEGKSKKEEKAEESKKAEKVEDSKPEKKAVSKPKEDEKDSKPKEEKEKSKSKESNEKDSKEKDKDSKDKDKDTYRTSMKGDDQLQIELDF